MTTTPPEWAKAECRGHNPVFFPRDAETDHPVHISQAVDQLLTQIEERSEAA